ncbi:hypothetical protein CIW83_21100 [Tissierella sp. P1]|nr:hypothetical protein CIW83_21100 [Tissierella sp. P1]
MIELCLIMHFKNNIIYKTLLHKNRIATNEYIRIYMLSIYCGIKFDLNIIKDIYVNKILVDDIVFIYGDLFFM